MKLLFSHCLFPSFGASQGGGGVGYGRGLCFSTVAFPSYLYLL